MFGDTVRGRRLKLTARATGDGTLLLVRNGTVVATGRAPRCARRSRQPGRYGIRLLRGQFTEAVGTPIWFRKGRRGRVTVRGC